MKQPLTNRLIYKLVNFFYNRRVCKKKFDLTIDDDGIKGLKAPFIALVNHSSNNDVFVTARALKKFQPNYLAAADQIARNRFFYRFFGAIPKRQFVSEISAVKRIKYVLDKGRPVVIFPEGKLSVDGKLGYLPRSIAKLVKFLGVTVVSVNIKGNYLGLPRWSKEQVRCKIIAKAEILLEGGELKKLPADEIYEKIHSALYHDEIAYQKENCIRIERDLKGLEEILYFCPNCGAEFQTQAMGNKIKCGKCGAEFVFDNYGGVTGAGSLTLWYERQRQAVKKELLERRYAFKAEADVWELPSAEGYRFLGKGIAAAADGEIRVEVGEKKFFFKSETMPAIPFDAGRGFFLSNTAVNLRLDVFGAEARQITKLALAVEESFKLKNLK